MSPSSWFAVRPTPASESVASTETERASIAASDIASAPVRHPIRTVLAEALWPTRCAICERLGSVLCDDCRRALPYIDHWQACARCGASFGRLQCCRCNTQQLRAMGIEELPIEGIVSATKLTAETHRIVTVYKDQGERRLAEVMAAIMAAATSPAWLRAAPTICAIPATPKALARRGFDHGALLARTYADLVGREFEPLIERPRTSDQRKLSRDERVANMMGRLRLRAGVSAPDAAIIVDDVTTTGSTLIAAAAGLAAGGVRRVYGLTFTTTG